MISTLRTMVLTAGCLAVVCTTTARGVEQDAANGTPIKPFGKIVSLDPRFDKIVGDAKMEALAEGFDWSEGPVWIPEKEMLLFSDIPPNRVMAWKPGMTEAKVFMHPAGYTGSKERGGEPGSNGMLLDEKGRLIQCEHGDRRIARVDNFAELQLGDKPNGKNAVKKTTLADRYNGKRFNSPNDAAIKSNGDIYFTDPPYGLEKNWDDPARELDFCGVYRVSTDGEVTLLTKEIGRPNGIAFSPDEKTLYVAQSDPAKAIWMAYDVKDDGTIENGRVFFDATEMAKGKLGLPDGLKVDQDGNLFATGPGGVLVFAPDGTHLGTFETGVATANVAWGGDGSTLYITADMYLVRIDLNTKGANFGKNSKTARVSAKESETVDQVATEKIPTVLFLCTGNSCRSQMAEGWAKSLKDGKIRAYSAGVDPHGLNPKAVQVMAEADVDISEHKSKSVAELADVKFDYVVTVCSDADEKCPAFGGATKVVHVGFDDPPRLAKNAATEAEALGHYRRVRDEIREFVESLPDSLTSETK